MLKDGLMQRFHIDQVYGMHNSPGMPVGMFGMRHGSAMAATDHLDIIVEGVGGHAALPHKSVDPVVASAQLIIALQSVVSRTVDPLESAVVSICHLAAGDARNVIPQNVELRGTVRTLTPETRNAVEIDCVDCHGTIDRKATLVTSGPAAPGLPSPARAHARRRSGHGAAAARRPHRPRRCGRGEPASSR